LIIGYYRFRGKAQVPRLLCEYLELPYQDLFLDPDQWKLFREVEAERWIVKDLPFLKQGDFVLTGNNAMITYVIELSGRRDLLGRTLEDMT
jgi:glutathione S-transferase